MKMNVYQEISQIIKEADGILIGNDKLCADKFIMRKL